MRRYPGSWVLGSLIAALILVPALFTGSVSLAQSSSSTGWVATGSLSTGRKWHTATLLPTGEVLVTGGLSTQDGTVLKSAELYNPASHTWMPTADMHTPRYGHTATLLTNGYVLVSGGGSSSLPGAVAVTTTELYSPTTGLWTLAADLNFARAYHTATLLDNGMVLVTGGAHSNTLDASRALTLTHGLNSVELYHPDENEWTYSDSMTAHRYGQVAMKLQNGNVIVAGGSDLALVDTTAELFIPQPYPGSWSSGGTLQSGHTFGSATLLQDGRVLIAGGLYDKAQATPASAELFDPSAASWSVTSALHLDRALHTARLFADGRVLVAGGSTVTTTVATSVASSEIYDPVLQTWGAPEPMQSAHAAHAATVLKDGRILVAGGDSSGQAAELYTPPSFRWSLLGNAGSSPRTVASLRAAYGSAVGRVYTYDCSQSWHGSGNGTSQDLISIPSGAGAWVEAEVPVSVSSSSSATHPVCSGWSLGAALSGDTIDSLYSSGITKLFGFSTGGWQHWGATLPAYAVTLLGVTSGQGLWMYR